MLGSCGSSCGKMAGCERTRASILGSDDGHVSRHFWGDFCGERSGKSRIESTRKSLKTRNRAQHVGKVGYMMETAAAPRLDWWG
jgi:hypothetical protein